MRITHTEDSLNVTSHAQRNPGWHTCGTNKRTQAAIARAVELGSIQTRRLPGGHNLQIQYRAYGEIEVQS